MSSEDDNEDSFEIRPIRWRSGICDEYFESLDRKAEKLMSKKAKRQTVKRNMGPFSTRSLPKDFPESLDWAIIK